MVGAKPCPWFFPGRSSPPPAPTKVSLSRPHHPPMLLPRILAPVRAVNSVSTSSARSLTPSNRALEALRTAALAPLSLTFVRHATHQSEGRANGAKDGAGRRLGAKKTAGKITLRHEKSNGHGNGLMTGPCLHL